MMHTAANRLFVPSCRTAYRTSCHSLSRIAHFHVSCVCSRINVALPNARRAAYRASSGGTPRSRCSSSSISRSERSSRSRSSLRFRSCHQCISALLGGRPHHPGNCIHHLLPLRLFDLELFAALLGQTVVLEFPISVRSHLPFGSDPSLALQPMQRRIQRSVLHLQEIVRRALNVLANLMSVRGPIEQRPQDEHVECSLQNRRSRLCLFCHSSYSTLDLATIVDTRPLVVKFEGQLR